MSVSDAAPIGSSSIAAFEPATGDEPIAQSTPFANTVSDWSATGAQAAEQAPFDLFAALGSIFGGAQNGQSGNSFDLGALLASIFDFAGTQATAAAPEGSPTPAAPQKNREEVSVSAREEANWSAETGDEHLKAKGRANAAIYAQANGFAETINDGKSVKARAGAEAVAGMSAEAEGSVHTDIGSIDGKARVSNEARASTRAEAEAGPNGLSASHQAEASVMAKAKADTNLNLGDGLVKGHADARAEAGAGAKADGKVGVTANPPGVVVNAKAEAFAGARAGYSAKGGVAGVGYGIECEVWAGVGATAEINGGIDKDGKFRFEFALGVAYGVGCKVKYGMEIDLKQVAKTAAQVVGVLGMGLGGIIGAIGGMFDGGSGDGKRAGQAVTQAVQKAAPAIGQLASMGVQQGLGDVAKDSQHEESSFEGEAMHSSSSFSSDDTADTHFDESSDLGDFNDVSTSEALS